ncbi:hypothetical protein [Algihabitans albus]|uniref:hypothetical protein n=1 Tax=Algihabitans albus TaxID=2164067 RepID=UPI000E5CE572|nr:hypothetical protein [Algihabitans albus]
MSLNLAPYRKLIVALIGALLIALDQFLGFSVSWEAEQIVNTLIPVLTAVGVWAVPNEALPDAA